MTTRLMTPEEVADRLACDVPAALALVREGTLKAVRLPGGEFRITPASLEAFLAGAEAARPSPYLNARQAADYLGISVRTLYNNRRHIPSLPGFRNLAFDPEVLKEVRSSQAFRNRRLADQRRRRNREMAASS